MRNIVIGLLFIGIAISCSAQKKENNMIEKYDFEALKNVTVHPVGIKKNGWTILIYTMTESGAHYNEYPPLPNFYWVQKTFYPSGHIKEVCNLIGRNLKIGEWLYYDEKGNIIKKVDEDKKFGRIKTEDLLRFIEKEGHINLETGEGFESATILENGKGEIKPSYFDINLIKEEKKEYWIIIIYPQPSNNWTETIYHIDKDTGEVLFKESQEKFPIM